MKTLDEISRLEYSALEFDCLTKIGKDEWHGETKCGLYIAVGHKAGVITISSSERLLDLGHECQIVARSKEEITLNKIIKYFDWRIDKEYILNNWF